MDGEGPLVAETTKDHCFGRDRLPGEWNGAAARTNNDQPEHEKDSKGDDMGNFDHTFIHDLTS